MAIHPRSCSPAEPDKMASAHPPNNVFNPLVACFQQRIGGNVQGRRCREDGPQEPWLYAQHILLPCSCLPVQAGLHVEPRSVLILSLSLSLSL